MPGEWYITLLKHGKLETNKPIAHSNLIGQLTRAVQLPSEVAIVKVKGHAIGEEEQAVGNRKADEAAKEAAKAQIKSPFDMGNKNQVAMAVHITNVPDIDIKILQSQPTQVDLEHWSKHNCAPDKDGLLRDEKGRIALPKPNLQHIILQRVFPNRTTFWLFTIQYRVFDVSTKM